VALDPLSAHDLRTRPDHAWLQMSQECRGQEDVLQLVGHAITKSARTDVKWTRGIILHGPPGESPLLLCALAVVPIKQPPCFSSRLLCGR
jgi:hypothetical protein